MKLYPILLILLSITLFSSCDQVGEPYSNPEQIRNIKTGDILEGVITSESNLVRLMTAEDLLIFLFFGFAVGFFISYKVSSKVRDL